LELGRTGITVNNVSPWLLEGARLNLVMENQASVQGLSPTVILEKLVAETATGRLVTSDDVFSVVRFLLQDSSRNFTGQDLNISAGAVTY
jgi:NAD(P)-dependent dehydrogenase (short-subunit alcohol dehydrogenase family)